MNENLNALLTGLLALGLDIEKAKNANKGLPGYVDQIANDPTVMASFKTVISHVTELPADFKALGVNELLALVPTLITGIQAIVAEAQKA